jgi:two-component system sensor histidine kinase KdpD
LVSGLLATLLALSLALLTEDLGPSSGVAIFMLAVTIAAVTGGLWGGVIAAVLASLLLPMIEEPDFALRFDDQRDIVAAVVFLAIAVVVGLVVGSAADERDRAARREREARLLALLSSKLLSGDLPDRVLDDFVQALMEPFGLAVCHVRVSLDGEEVEARATAQGRMAGGPTEVVPVVIADVPLGTIAAERPSGGHPFTRDERFLLEAATRLAQLDAETNQLRAAMVSSVTHDLRTPLASIKAGVTSLLDTDVRHDEAQERDLLTTILEETDRLNRLVGNILDLAKIRAGALIPRRSPTAIDEVAEAVVARLRPRLQDRRLTVELMLGDDLPEVPADPVQIDQVLTNLLENAARHSPADGIVRLRIASEERSIRVRISDEGPGIPREEHERVFEAFYRGRQSPESAGTGLGLAIAKAIVTAHGGRIWIEETTGGGTAMVFEVPLEEAVVL